METAANKQVPDILNDLVKKSVLETFGSICGMEPDYKGKMDGESPCEAVVGIISLVGVESWSIMVGLPRGTASVMAEKFAGFEIPFESEDMGDAVGELTNILAGDVCARFDEEGIKTDLSLPTITRGSDLELLSPRKQSSTSLEFALPEGRFWITLVSMKVE